MPEDEAKKLIVELMPQFEVTLVEREGLKRVLVRHPSGRFGPDAWPRAQGTTWGDCACAVVLSLVRANGGTPEGQLFDFIDEWYPDWLDYYPGEPFSAAGRRPKFTPEHSRFC